MRKEPRIRRTMDSQHAKRSEALLKSARQYLCYIFDYSEEKSARKILF